MLIKGVAYRKMFLSFLTVFAIPLCAIFLFYYVSFSITEKQAETLLLHWLNENFPTDGGNDDAGERR